MGCCNYDDGFVLEILPLHDIEHYKLLLLIRCTLHDRIVLCKASDERQLWALTYFKLAVCVCVCVCVCACVCVCVCMCVCHVMAHSFIAVVVPGHRTLRSILGFSRHQHRSCIMLSDKHCISFCLPGWKLTWGFVTCIWNSNMAFCKGHDCFH
jgi:hypothetical protein